MSTQEAALGAAPRALLRPLTGMWQRASVRAQLLAVFVAIDVAAALLGGGATILDARSRTRVEVAASMRLAELLVGEAVGLMQQEIPAEQFLTDLAPRLRLVRHVRLEVRDAAGALLPVGARGPARPEERTPAPAWFAALIAPPPQRQEVPVTVNGQRIGTIAIVGEPNDEIAEVWGDTVVLGAAALAVNLAVVALLYFVFGRVLDPLTELAGGLSELERRHYEVRLPRPRTRELAAITERFNALAAALEASRAENLALNHRLITAQDDERRRTALELHDEVGPSLFGLKANAASIEKAAAELAAGPGQGIGEQVRARARDMLAIIAHVQGINRGLLNRLRPMALGHVPLADILAELVGERARAHPEMRFGFAADGIARGYGDSIDLTIYRCVQEGVTNAIRHAQAKQIDVALAAADGTLTLTVRDDGRGIAPGAPPGFGLSGMRERVQGLGGTCAIESGEARGTCVRIAIPVAARAPVREESR